MLEIHASYASLVHTYTQNINIFVFVKYYIIIRAGMSKHMQVWTCHVGPACSVEEANFVPARKDFQFLLTELLKYVQILWMNIRMYVCTYCVCVCVCVCMYVWGGADKSLARPGRKQATATKLGIYSTHSPRSSIHFLANCHNFCKPLKKKNSEGCPSNQVSAAAMTSASDEKWRPFNFFFSPGNRSQSDAARSGE